MEDQLRNYSDAATEKDLIAKFLPRYLAMHHRVESSGECVALTTPPTLRLIQGYFLSSKPKVYQTDSGVKIRYQNYILRRSTPYLPKKNGDGRAAFWSLGLSKEDFLPLLVRSKKYYYELTL